MRPRLEHACKTLAALPLIIAVHGCNLAREPEPPETQLKVITTVLPVTLFTEAVAGSCAVVTTLLPAGADPHAFQARPGDIDKLRQADVLVINGLGLEQFLKPLLEGAENPALAVIDSSAGIKPLPLGPSAGDSHHRSHHLDEHGDDAETAVDPHVWLDPRLAMQQVQTIRDALVEADPSCQEGYRARARAYLASLEDLDRDLAEQLKPFFGRHVVGFHDVLAYFARRYNLNNEALVALPEDQPTPGDLQRISGVLRNEQVHGVLSEPGGGTAALNALAADLDLKVEVFDPLELVPAGEQPDPALYGRVMRSNGTAVAATLQP